jgi:hypothetical protein
MKADIDVQVKKIGKGKFNIAIYAKSKKIKKLKPKTKLKSKYNMKKMKKK